MKRPAFKFDVRAWRSDVSVARCNANTRGVWFEVLAAMNESGATGTLSGTFSELAKVLRFTKSEVMQAVKQLQVNGTADVTLCNGRVTITNRRMAREHKEREQTKLRVQQFRERRDVTPLKQEFPKPNAFQNSLGASEKILRHDELKRVESTMQKMRDAKPWTEAQVGEFKRLKARKSELLSILGMAV